MAFWRCEACGRTFNGDSPPRGGEDCVPHDFWRPGANHPFTKYSHDWVNETEQRNQEAREEQQRQEAKKRTIEAQKREEDRKREEQRVYSEWLASPDGQRWQESERLAKENSEKEKLLLAKRKKRNRFIRTILSLVIGLIIGIGIGYFIGSTNSFIIGGIIGLVSGAIIGSGGFKDSSTS